MLHIYIVLMYNVRCKIWSFHSWLCLPMSPSQGAMSEVCPKGSGQRGRVTFALGALDGGDDFAMGFGYGFIAPSWDGNGWDMPLKHSRTMVMYPSYRTCNCRNWNCTLSSGFISWTWAEPWSHVHFWVDKLLWSSGLRTIPDYTLYFWTNHDNLNGYESIFKP